MKLQKTTEYSLRILIFMAKNPKQIHSAKSIIDHLNISDKYLRRIITRLSKFGFVESVQGKDGGYYFSKGIDKIFISEVIDKFEGINKFAGCVLGFNECSSDHPCALHSKWMGIRTQLIKMLNETNLESLKIEDIKFF
jgi:Rrf2 family iron-sulfur cluster assembly transcriptional regulator